MKYNFFSNCGYILKKLLILHAGEIIKGSWLRVKGSLRAKRQSRAHGYNKQELRN